MRPVQRHHAKIDACSATRPMVGPIVPVVASATRGRGAHFHNACGFPPFVFF